MDDRMSCRTRVTVETWMKDVATGTLEKFVETGPIETLCVTSTGALTAS